MLNAIKSSALFERLESISVNVVGQGDITLPYEDQRLTVVRRSPDITSYEMPTLDALWDYCNNHDEAIVVYFNCLGGRHLGRAWATRWHWRRMLYFLFLGNFERSSATLVDHDVCGPAWVGMPLPHMASNNWMANARYIRKLGPPTQFADIVEAMDLTRYGAQWSNLAAKRRHAAEFWIGMQQDVKPVGLLPFGSKLLPKLKILETVPWWLLSGVDWELLARTTTYSPRRDRLAMLAQVLRANILWKVRLGRAALLRKEVH